MPGILGYICGEAPHGFLDEMSLALEDNSRFRRDLHAGEGYGLGRVSLGLLDQDCQPVWSRDRNLVLVMEGEFYNADELKTRLAQAGRSGDIDSDAELALGLYESLGDHFAELINGSFVLAIWDERRRRLVITNDRLGLHPLYHATTGRGFLFASGVRALLTDPTLRRYVDRVAIAEFLTFDHVLGQRTMLESVRLLEQGSILTYEDGRTMVESYWVPEHPEHYELRSEEEWADELIEHLRQAVRRQIKDDLPAGLLLSGGLDSRVLLALMHDERQAGSFRSFTWGVTGNDDARFARELASGLGVHHDFFELQPQWLIEQADEAVRITDGLGNITNLHAFATLEQEAELVKVLYKGFLGDAMMGFAFRPLFWADYDSETTYRAHFQNYLDMRVLTFTPDEQSRLFTKPFGDHVREQAWDDFKSGMAESKSRQLANQRIHFDFRQRVPRMTIKGVEVARNRLPVRLPFADNDLVEFTFRVPPGYWYERRLMRTAFIRHYPQLAKVPLSNTGLPMISCARDVRLRAQKFVRWHLHEAGLRQVSPTGVRPYKNYDGWFRTTLAPWVSETLLDRRTLDRGYFRPDFVKQLVNEHMVGANHASKLGALMSIELWHRQFLD